MAINSVDMTKALNNEAYAAQVIRSGKCDESERLEIINAWKIKNIDITKYESVDRTNYEIDLTEGQKTAAHDRGEKKADEKTGDFDGKSDGGKSAAAFAVAASTIAGAAAAIIAFGPKAVWGAMKNGYIALASAVGLLALSLGLKKMDPNSEQAKACDDMAPLLKEANSELERVREDVSNATNEITDDTDKLIKKNEEKTKAEDEYKKRKEGYESSGQPLTNTQKAGLDQQYGLIESLTEEGAGMNSDLANAMDKQEDLFDAEGEMIEEVQGMTDYQAEFDEATVDNTALVKTAAYAGMGAATGIATGAALHTWKWWSGETFAAIGAIAAAGTSGVVLGKVVAEQNEYQQRAETGVANREETQGVNEETRGIYEQDLDTLAADIEYKNDTEETLTVIRDDVVRNEEGGETPAAGPATENPFVAAPEGAGNEEDTPPTVAPPTTSPAPSNSGGDDSNPFVDPNDKDPEK